MKTNEKKDLQTKTKDELVKLIKEAQSALMQLKLSHEQAKLQNTRDIFNTRKRIAVLQSILSVKPAEVKAEAKETKKKEGKK